MFVVVFGVMLFVVLFVVFDVLLVCVIGDVWICVGVLVVNCECVEVVGLIGFFVNMLVIDVDVFVYGDFLLLVECM